MPSLRPGEAPAAEDQARPARVPLRRGRGAGRLEGEAGEELRASQRPPARRGRPSVVLLGSTRGVGHLRVRQVSSHAPASCLTSRVHRISRGPDRRAGRPARRRDGTRLLGQALRLARRGRPVRRRREEERQGECPARPSCAAVTDRSLGSPTTTARWCRSEGTSDRGTRGSTAGPSRTSRSWTSRARSSTTSTS